ncbi:MAG: hypothetical protein MMC33_008241, partial [Icmadophila ericetorum]|nr:hypothetical protein [Icmadophila ericetorum]
FPLSYGVFQNYYSQHEAFRGSNNIPVVGTLATGMLYLGGPLTTPLVKRYRQYQPHMIWAGLLLCTLGLVVASFAQTVQVLILSQGLLYGIGVLLLFYPILSMVNEWFIQKRGLAYGIQAAATGFSGLIIPFIAEALLRKYGYSTTLRAFAVGMAALAIPFAPFCRGRGPAIHHSITTKTDFAFLKKPLFYFYATCNFFQGLGCFFPYLFLPSFATAIGLSPTTGALLIALISVTQVIGQLTFGFLSDGRLSLNFLIFMSALPSAVAILTLWGFAYSLLPLVFFALLYGFFVAGNVILWARMGTTLSDDPHAALAIYSVFAFEKGIGNVLAGPISAALISDTTIPHVYGVGRYRQIILFAGGSITLVAIGVLLWSIKARKFSLRIT